MNDNKNKFEKTRVLSARTLQISENAPILVDRKNEVNSFKLAMKEFRENKTPLKVIQKTTKEVAKNMEDGVD